ncbi:unnamed protein product [Chrysoparadoxa australica]
MRTKSAVIATLVLQNTSQSLLMKLASKTSDHKDRFAPTTAVVCAEVCKLLFSLAVQTKLDGGGKGLVATINRDVVSKPGDVLLMAVPAALYVLQNNLAYVAISHLAPSTFQVLYQLKILTTALCSVLIMRKQLSGVQWSALVMLSCGAALVQFSPDSVGWEVKPSTGYALYLSNSLIGLGTVLLACATSGIAGVFFESMLKGSDTSLWVRNMELSAYGVLLGLIAVLGGPDSGKILGNGFFFGYNPYVWGSICLNSLGGILVALVVKHADTVVKGFATSVSVVLTALLSSVYFGFQISHYFISGAIMVFSSTILYGNAGAAAAAKATSYPSTSSTSRCTA